MSPLAGPVFAVAGVMGVAGVLKLAHPAQTGRALGAAALPGTELTVRFVAITEIIVATSVIAFGNALTAALVSALYAAFALFSIRVMRRTDNTVGCGCFGETAGVEPIGWVHVAMNLAAASLCAAAVAWPTGSLLEVVGDQPLAGSVFMVLTALCGWLWYLILTMLPGLLGPDRWPASTAARA